MKARKGFGLTLVLVLMLMLCGLFYFFFQCRSLIKRENLAIFAVAFVPFYFLGFGLFIYFFKKWPTMMMKVSVYLIILITAFVIPFIRSNALETRVTTETRQGIEYTVTKRSIHWDRFSNYVKNIPREISENFSRFKARWQEKSDKKEI